MSNRLGWPTSDVLGVPVAIIRPDEFVAKIVQVGAGPELQGPIFCTYLNAACSNAAADDSEYYQILSRSDCVYPDGQSIVWASGVTGTQLPGRVNAGDFIISFLEAARDAELSLALIGGRPEVAERAANKWRNQVAGIQIKYIGDGYFADDVGPVKDVAAVKADILLVGLGAPRQEKWSWKYRYDVRVKVIWCVGALFEYYGEDRGRAPIWMRNVGLEWLFRLILEPRRLWRRYLIGNVRFIWRVYFRNKRLNS